MYTIKIMNEYLHGPIWVYDEDGFVRKKFPVLENSATLTQMNEQVRILFDECYKFDEQEKACVFDEEIYKRNYPEIKGLIEDIIQELERINDGSFVVEDHFS